MDRRFLVKIEVNAPNEATRMKIWKSKLPQTSENELSIIARDYSFSGGHIDNVATLAIVESIMNGTNKVTLDLLIKYCKNAISFTNKDKRKRIGF
jgi:SpoVK/Ycf46/Vps4 family AAA+-type ATPase